MFDCKRGNAIVATLFLTVFLATSSFGKTVEIIFFNDFHGAVAEDTSLNGKNPGMEKFVTAVKKR